MIRAKRVYDPPAKDDGYRVLIDRLWPRGLSKSAAKIDLWLKDIAPSAALRKWFGHDIEKWPAFEKRYGAEIKDKREELQEIKRLEAERGTVTLLFGAKDAQHCNAAVLCRALKRP